MILLDKRDKDSEKFIKNKLEELNGKYLLLPLEVDSHGAFII